jgi:uncharacterized protein YlxW (UPF0749 family)
MVWVALLTTVIMFATQQAVTSFIMPLLPDITYANGMARETPKWSAKTASAERAARYGDDPSSIQDDLRCDERSEDWPSPPSACTQEQPDFQNLRWALMMCDTANIISAILALRILAWCNALCRQSQGQLNGITSGWWSTTIGLLSFATLIRYVAASSPEHAGCGGLLTYALCALLLTSIAVLHEKRCASGMRRVSMIETALLQKMLLDQREAEEEVARLRDELKDLKEPSGSFKSQGSAASIESAGSVSIESDGPVGIDSLEADVASPHGEEPLAHEPAGQSWLLTAASRYLPTVDEDSKLNVRHADDDVRTEPRVRAQWDRKRAQRDKKQPKVDKLAESIAAVNRSQLAAERHFQEQKAKRGAEHDARMASYQAYYYSSRGSPTQQATQGSTATRLNPYPVAADHEELNQDHYLDVFDRAQPRSADLSQP